MKRAAGWTIGLALLGTSAGCGTSSDGDSGIQAVVLDGADRGTQAESGGGDGPTGADVPQGVDVVAAMDAVVGTDARPGTDVVSAMDVRTGTDVVSAMDVATGTDVVSAMDVRTGTDVVSGTDARADVVSAPDVVAADVPVSTAVPQIAGCNIFPADNPWNQDVSALPLHTNSANYIANMNPARGLHADWGDWSTNHYGIPWQTGTGAPPVAFHWTTSWGNTESDVRPCSGAGGMFCYPIPTSARIEGGSAAPAGDDRHVLYLDTAGAPNNCTLYEIYNTQNFVSAPWQAANGAIFPLGTDALRPDQWTSADAAGLPILPGLVRFDEVAAGEIRHAIRFTMNNTFSGFIHPATHAAGSTTVNLPPMGLRLRLRASFNLTTFSGPALVILRAMQRYGIILADNGSDWYFTGDSDDRWTATIDGINTAFGRVHGSDFVGVDTGPVIPGL
jgi:hypothetical protein